MLLTADRLSTENFNRIATLVTRHAGIKLPETKRSMIEGRVARRAREAGFASIGAYCDFLADPANLAAEARHLVDISTTNKTDFFREPRHFDFLREVALPALLRARTSGAPLKFWSAASSNGAEAYTLAMVLSEAIRAGAAFDFRILGTDIASTMIAAARQAVYPAAMIEPVPEPMQRRYTMESRSAGDARVRIVPELRSRAKFAELNLMDAHYPYDRTFDVILLRNVLIYFERDVQHAVIRRLCTHLHKGGYLLLGHSESMIGVEVGLKQVEPAVFQV
ncbi:CheR family methyltransferase [Sphingomonas sp. RS6]